MSTISPKNLKNAIYTNNIEILCKSPGVGKKTAERMVLELKDKVDISSIDDIGNVIDLADDEALEALTSLGYSRYEVNRALSGIDRNLSIEEIIKEGLKRLSKH